MGRNVVDIGFGAIKHFRLPPGGLGRENYYTLIHNTYAKSVATLQLLQGGA